MHCFKGSNDNALARNTLSAEYITRELDMEIMHCARNLQILIHLYASKLVNNLYVGWADSYN